jgi:hypothetical protein
MKELEPVNNSNFPDYYTIDDDGLSSLNYFLRQHFENKTVRISVEIEEELEG